MMEKLQGTLRKTNQQMEEALRVTRVEGGDAHFNVALPHCEYFAAKMTARDSSALPEKRQIC